MVYLLLKEVHSFVNNGLIKKIVFEGRFQSNLLVMDNRGEIHYRWRNTFSEAALNNERIILKEPNLPAEAYVSHSNFGTIFEDVTNESKFEDISKKFALDIVELLRLEHLGRIGVRVFYLYTVENLNDLIQNIKDNMFSFSNWDQLGDSIKQLNFLIATTDGNVNFRFNCQTIKRESKEVILEGRESFYPEYGLLIDVDVFRKNEGTSKFGTSHIPKFIKFAVSKSREKADYIASNILRKRDV